jgi:hypothetical protein
VRVQRWAFVDRASASRRAARAQTSHSWDCSCSPLGGSSERVPRNPLVRGDRYARRQRRYGLRDPFVGSGIPQRRGHRVSGGVLVALGSGPRA